MTQEEKELLLKDLCARLPYGIKCYYNSPEIDDDIQYGVSIVNGFQNDGILIEIESGDIIDIEYIKSYLRPMSSMTDEEKEEIKSLFSKFTDEFGKKVLVVRQNKMALYQDWLNKHHFDYRGLIEKGLALEASEGMYK